MPRPRGGIIVVLVLASLTLTGNPGAQPKPQEPPTPASIWRQPRGASTSPADAAVPLETNDPRFQAYFSKVREQIKATWIYPSVAGERGIQGEVVVEFRIAKDGRLESAYVRRSSGAAILDDYSLRAVQTAAPFPPVPDDVAHETLVIASTFRYVLPGGSPRTK